MWSTSPEHAKRLVTLPEDAFVDAVNNAFVCAMFDCIKYILLDG